MADATDKYLLALIKTWIGLIVTNLNTSLTTKSITNLSEVTTSLDIGNIGATESDYRYMIKLVNLEIEDTEAENNMVIDTVIELGFALNNDEVAKYKSVIDNILYPLIYRLTNYNGVANLSYRNATVSTSFKIVRIYERKVTDMNLIENGYYKPKISFKLEVTDFV